MTDKHNSDKQGATFGEKVRGSFDLFLMFGRGIRPFEKEGTFRHAMLSLWFVALNLPFGYLSGYLYHPQGMEDAPYSAVAIFLTGFTVLSFIFTWSFSWLFAVLMERKDRFWLWFQVSNWMTIPNFIIGVVALLIAVFSNHTRAEMDHVFTLLTYYEMLVSGCVVFRALKIDWLMAGFFVGMSVEIGQLLYNFMFWTQGYVAP